MLSLLPYTEERNQINGMAHSYSSVSFVNWKIYKEHHLLITDIVFNEFVISGLNVVVLLALGSIFL